MTTESILAAVANNRSLWVELECPWAFPIPPIEGMTPVTDPLHCTLFFAGKGQSDAYVTKLIGWLKYETSHYLTMTSNLTGIARFRGNATEGDPIVLLVNDRRVRQMSDELHQVMVVSRDWDYFPHISLGRVPRGAPWSAALPTLNVIAFNSVALCAGEARVSFQLGRTP